MYFWRNWPDEKLTVQTWGCLRNRVIAASLSKGFVVEDIGDSTDLRVPSLSKGLCHHSLLTKPILLLQTANWDDQQILKHLKQISSTNCCLVKFVCWICIQLQDYIILAQQTTVWSAPGLPSFGEIFAKLYRSHSFTDDSRWHFQELTSHLRK